ncbi:hypothetical protein NYQ10_10200 [Flavobacterium johnsoniae]|uniref:hypothetical protein n=1 Tax=Flavobacterium johnsoniae TaxID=986 RepID=UPI0025AFDBF4|nr:hypothetical protein [Flavobacterium johnsoniae]WJS96806.1 hypothetical protein NYQ10_10200 [Flavobacterium johnsoniae]
MKSFYTSLTVFLVFLILMSCNNDKLVLSDPSASLIDSLSMIAANEHDSVQVDISIPAAKGSQWRALESWFKNCAQNETFKKDIVYLGHSSDKRLGYILSKDISIDRADFYKVCTDEDVINTFYNPGKPVTKCDLSKEGNFSFSAIVDFNAVQNANADLKVLLSRSKNIQIKSGKWRIESFDSDAFLDFINSSDDPKIKAYKKSLNNKNNVVLVKILKVYEFSAEVEIKDSIDIGLKAKLDNGIDVNLVGKESKNQIGFDLHFKKTGKNKISITSQGEVALFAQAATVKKLTE